MKSETPDIKNSRTMMPVEWLLLFGAVSIWLLYQYFQIPMPGLPGPAYRYGPVLFYLKQVYASLYLYALMFVGVVVAYLLQEFTLSKSEQRKWMVRKVFERIGRRFTFQQFLIDARLLHAVVLMFVEFQLLKHVIPLVNPILFDAEFAAVDRFICGGLCGEVLYSLFGERSAHTASSHYTWYFPYMIGVVLLILSTCCRRVQHEYVLSFVLLFLFGILWVYVAPTLGPAFYYPESFVYVKETHSGLLQSDLWQNWEILRIDPRASGAIFSISGFPSLHVAVVLLGSIYTLRINLWLGLTSFSFLLLTLNSTLLLGWHYLMDDIGSVFLVMCCMVFSKRFPWGSE
jgi:hypothetical protein